MNFTLHLTHECSMRGRYCYAPPTSSPRMSQETGIKALALAEHLSAGQPCGIVFFGGEPLLCKPVMQAIVAHARAGGKRFHWKVTTNGLALDDVFLAWSLEVGMQVALSMDGTREVHDRHRLLPNGAPTFDLLLPRLRRLLRFQPDATVFAVVNPDTADRLSDSVTLLLGEGVRYLVLSLNYGAVWSAAQLQALGQQYQRLAALYLEWTRAGRKFYLSPFEMCIASHVAGPRAGELRCDLGTKQISVDPEGWLYPCVQFPRAGPAWRIGHVDTGIDQAALQRLRQQANRPAEPCTTCALEPRCPRTCACLNHQGTGNIDQVPPLLCQDRQLLVPVADQVAAALWAERDPTFLQKHYNRAWPLLSLLDDYRQAERRGRG